MKKKERVKECKQQEGCRNGIMPIILVCCSHSYLPIYIRIESKYYSGDVLD